VSAQECAQYNSGNFIATPALVILTTENRLCEGWCRLRGASGKVRRLYTLPTYLPT